MLVEVAAEQVEDLVEHRIAHGVDDAGSHPARDQDAAVAEDRKLPDATLADLSPPTSQSALSAPGRRLAGGQPAVLVIARSWSSERRSSRETCICEIPTRSSLALLLLDPLGVDRELDLVADEHAARFERDVVRETPILAVDLGLGGEADSGVTPR